MNKKGVIFNSIVAGLGLFTIIFLAVPYMSAYGFGVSGFGKRKKRRVNNVFTGV